MREENGRLSDQETICVRPATRNEARYVLAELADAGSYMISMGHRVEGALDVARLRRAFETVVTRHEALRTRFLLMDRRVAASVEAVPAYRFHHVRIPDADPETFRSWALPLVFGDVCPHEAGSLVRLIVAESGGYWRFTVAMHHAVSDGFSRGVVNKELLKLYAGEDLPDPASYASYATLQAGLAADRVVPVVDNFPIPARMPGDGNQSEDTGSRGLFVDRDASHLAIPLRTAAKAQGATRFAVLAAAYGLGLRAFTGERSISSFFQSEGRQVLGAPNSVVGPFSNTLPLDLSLDESLPFGSYVRVVSDRLQSSLALENSDISERLSEAGKSPSVSLNMFPPAPRIRAGNLDVGPREFLDRRTEFDLNLVWTEDSGALIGRAFYNGARLSAARVTEFLELQVRLLETVVRTPDGSCSEILRTAQVHAPAVLRGTAEEPPPPGRIHHAFLSQARSCPHAPAVVTSTTEWSYGELAQRAQAHAAALREAGADPAVPVAILARRSPDLVAAMLGISVFGAPFAVIDASYPEGRIAVMLEEMGARHLFLADAAVGSIAARGARIVAPLLDHEGAPLAIEESSRAVAYLLFTSGTTGRPKRVMHPDATLMRFIQWQARTLSGTGCFRTMLLAGLSHDPVMRDIFLPLSFGGAIVIPAIEETRNPEALRRLIADAEPNVLHLTPATGKLIAAGRSHHAPLSSVDAVFWGGDRLEPAQVREWLSLAPRARQFNLYGATETPQAALIHEIAPDEAKADRVPVGRPVPWTGVRIEECGGIAGRGCLGEIVIELGDPVAGTRGPDGGVRSEPAKDHYTGDLGFLLPDVGVQLVGRSDGQIKLNSLRIELSEISHQAERIEGVSQAVAAQEGKVLELYLVTEDAAISETRVRSALSRVLPPYMVPQRIFFTYAIPLTPNGKVDRAALPEFVRREPQAAQGFGPPSGADEERIASVYERYTGRRVTDRTSSLAHLGADSLSSIEVRLALEGLGLNLPEGWEWMPLAELARCFDNEERLSRFGSLMQRRLETFIVLRCLAIAAIVAAHSGMGWLGGASVMLFALAGYGFGRLQLPVVLSGESTGPVWATLLKLLIPLVPASLVIFAVHVQVGNDPHPSAILFYENVSKFVDGVLLGREDDRHHITWLWFLHAYLQLFLVVGLLLSVRKLREFTRADPWKAVLIFFAVAEVVAHAAIYASAYSNADIGHVSALLQRSPTTLMPVLALGALLALAETRERLLITGAAILAHFGLQNLGVLGGAEGLWVAALALVVAVPSVRLPGIIAVAVLAVSAEALIIYLSHRAVLFAMESALGFEPPVILGAFSALAAGVLLGKALRPLTARLGIERMSQVRVST